MLTFRIDYTRLNQNLTMIGKEFRHSGLILFFASFITLSPTLQPALAQYGGVSTVETASAQRQVLSNFADVQGRVTTGASDAITAFTNARVRLAPLKIGDFVKVGQKIAQKSSEKLKARLSLL